MPLPPIPLLHPGVVKAACHAAAPSASSMTSAALASLLAREAWRRTPEWVKEDETLRSFGSSSSSSSCSSVSPGTICPKGSAKEKNNDTSSSLSSSGDIPDGVGVDADSDEMASIAALLRKLQALASSGSAKLNAQGRPVAMSKSQLHAAVIASIQLAWQIQERHPELRDELYHGQQKDVTTDGAQMPRRADIRELPEALWFAVLAYYDEEYVRKELKNFRVGVRTNKSNHGKSSKACDICAERDEEGKEGDFVLLEHQQCKRPGEVSHFVAVSQTHKKMVISVRGTSTLEDMLTDCCGRAVTYDVSGQSPDYRHVESDLQAVEVYSRDDIVIGGGGTDGFESRGLENFGTGEGHVIDLGMEASTESESGGEGSGVEVHNREGVFIHDNSYKVRCHEGILISAKRLANDVAPFVEHVALRCHYRIVLCGHSLGAGAASLLALILRARFPSLLLADAIQVYAFASPPVLDHDAALSSAPFITTVVNNSDVVPRTSLSNVGVYLEFLKVVHRRLEENGVSPRGPRSAARFVRMLAKGVNGEMIMTADEVRDATVMAHDRLGLDDPDHLYVPGKVLVLSERWGDRQRRRLDGGAEIEERSCVASGNGMKTKGMKSGESRDDSGNDHVDGINRAVHPANIHGAIANGAATALRVFDFDLRRMAYDHLCYSYEASINALIDKIEGKVGEDDGRGGNNDDGPREVKTLMHHSQ